MTTVIAISGKAESGKDASAIIMKRLFENFGQNSLIISYADYLKYICKQYFDWDGKKDAHGRGLLQHIGTDVVRKKNQYFWVDTVINFIKIFENQYDYFLIPDCRFPDEVLRLREKGMQTISLRIERLNYENSLSEEQRNHLSETSLDDFDSDATV